MSMKEIAKNLGGVLSRNSPTILTGMAVGGLITTAVLAVKATPKALYLLEQEELYREENAINGNIEPISRLDTVKICYRCYIPSVAVGAASIACIIGANHISLRRNAALASIYTITESAFKEYQAKVTETLGRNKELKIRDEIESDRVKANPPGANEVIVTGQGRCLMCDGMFGRYFYSDIEKVRRVVSDFRAGMYGGEEWVSLNEFYDALGLSYVKLGDELGWDLSTGEISIDFSTTITEDGQPCIVLCYDIKPKFYKEGRY